MYALRCDKKSDANQVNIFEVKQNLTMLSKTSNIRPLNMSKLFRVNVA